MKAYKQRRKELETKIHETFDITLPVLSWSQSVKQTHLEVIFRYDRFGVKDSVNYFYTFSSFEKTTFILIVGTTQHAILNDGNSVETVSSIIVEHIRKCRAAAK